MNTDYTNSKAGTNLVYNKKITLFRFKHQKKDKNTQNNTNTQIKHYERQKKRHLLSFDKNNKLCNK